MKKTNFSFKSLLLAAGLLLGSANAWGGDEVYNFRNFISGLTDNANLVKGTSVTVGASTMYLMDDFTTANYSMQRYPAREFNTNGRFAVGSETWQLRRKSDAGYQIRPTSAAGTLSILNLNEGDKITFDFTTAEGDDVNTNEGKITITSTNIKVSDGEAVEAGTSIVDGTTYEMTADGHMDLAVAQYVGFRKITITPNPDVETVTAPTITAVGANGVNRTIGISGGSTTKGDASITSYRYTLDGTTPTASVGTLYDASDKPVISTTTTIKAVAISSTGKASIATTTSIPAGTTLTLNAPKLTVTNFTKSGETYYPQYTFGSDQNSVTGNPSVTYSYTIAGEDNAVANPTGYSEAKAGQLVVTAHADGYESASAEAVTVIPYVLSKSWDFSDVDYVLNSNWAKASSNVTFSQGGYTIKGDRYTPTAAAVESGLNVEDALISGLTFNRNVSGYYQYVTGLGIGQTGGDKINNMTVTVSGLTEKDYTTYVKYHEDNRVVYAVQAGTGAFTVGKIHNSDNATGHCLHGIFVYSPKNEIIGAMDCSTYYLTDMTDKVTLAPGESCNYKFVNHNSNGSDNSKNWVLPVYVSGAAEPTITLRSDNWEDKAWKNDGCLLVSKGTDDVWADFINQMNGATVDMTVNYTAERVVNVSCDITTSGGKEWTYTYNSNYAGSAISFTANVDIALSVSGSWAEILAEGKVVSETLNANMQGYKTFYNATSNYEVDANTTIYKAAAPADGKVVLTAVSGNVVPKATPVILKTSAATIEITPTSTASTGDFEGNALTYKAEAGTIDNAYILGYFAGAGNGLGFYKYTASLPAGSIYVTSASLVKSLRIVVDGEATGIAAPEVAEKAEEGVFYNLNGQVVTEDYKGIIIKNGKKFLNK